LYVPVEVIVSRVPLILLLIAVDALNDIVRIEVFTDELAYTADGLDARLTDVEVPAVTVVVVIDVPKSNETVIVPVLAVSK
jgi:hypothetical protein